MIPFAVRALCLLPLLTGTLSASASPAGRVEIPVQSGGAFSVPVFSMKEQRFQKTLHQQYDFSCGSAALATLLTHHYNFPVREQDVFRAMLTRGERKHVLVAIAIRIQGHEGRSGTGYGEDRRWAELG